MTGSCTTVGSRTFLGIAFSDTAYGAERLERMIKALDARRTGWGLHALDVNISLGNLIEIVGREGQAWTSRAAPNG
jgi:hypothetical protein